MMQTIIKPFRAVFRFFKTGTIDGYPVSRNPLAWIPAILVTLILIPVFIVVLPVALIANLIGLAFSRPRKNRDNQADLIDLIEECEQVHMSGSEVNFQHWKDMARQGNYVQAAQGFMAEAESKKQGMPHGYWVYLRRLSKYSE